jgi:DNA polymerase (family 10)
VQQLDPAFFPRAHEVEASLALQDFHIHTGLTDGAGTLEEFVVLARDLGYRRIAFSEHADNTSKWLPEQYLARRDALRQLAGPMEVYLGAEVKACDVHGNIDLADETIRQLDFIMGVVHRYPRPEGGYHSFTGIDPARAQELDFAITKQLLQNPLIDIWGHPGGVYAQRVGPYDAALLDELVGVAEANGKIVEVNVNTRYSHAYPHIVESVLRRNTRISLGSDSHSPNQFQRSQSLLRDAVGQLRAGRGLPPSTEASA